MKAKIFASDDEKNERVWSRGGERGPRGVIEANVGRVWEGRKSKVTVDV